MKDLYGALILILQESVFGSKICFSATKLLGRAFIVILSERSQFSHDSFFFLIYFNYFTNFVIILLLFSV